MRDEHPHLRVVGMWWSAKPADVPLTITTQLSWNRRWQLKAMCRSWGGPLAAVLHLRVPLHRLTRSRGGSGRSRTLNDVGRGVWARAVATVADFHARMEAQQPCKMDLMLVAEPYRDDKSMVLYPVNTLRNYARLMARTPLIGVVDVDLIVSAGLRQEMRDPAAAAAYVAAAEAAVAAAAAGRAAPAYATGASRTQSESHHRHQRRQLQQQHQQREMLAEVPAAAAVAGAGGSGTGRRVAYVLPAFVTQGGSVETQVARADKLVAGSKEQLRHYYEQKKVVRFDPGSNGHENTNYRSWFQTNQPYTVRWSGRYEPWLFVDRLSSSWADARFRGYGKNKIVHIRTMAYEGYELVVHPTAFLVHRPHADSKSSSAHARSSMYGWKGSNTSMYGHNSFLYRMVQRGMADGNYTPVVDPATAACRQLLSWWRRPAPSL